MFANKSKEEMRARLEEFKRRKHQSKEISKSNLLKDVAITTNKLTTTNQNKPVKINTKALPSSKATSLTVGKENINCQDNENKIDKPITKKFISVKSRLFKPTVSSSLKTVNITVAKETNKISPPSQLKDINKRIEKLKTPQKEKEKETENNIQQSPSTPKTPQVQKDNQLSPLSAIKNKIQKLKTPQKSSNNNATNADVSIVFTPSKINGIPLNEALQRSLKKKRESIIENQVCLSDELTKISDIIKDGDMLKGGMNLGILEKDNWDKIRQMALYWQIKIQILEGSPNNEDKMKINDIYFDALATMNPDSVDYKVIENDYDRYLTEEIHKEEQSVVLKEIEENQKKEKEEKEQKEKNDEEESKKKALEESKIEEKKNEIEKENNEIEMNNNDGNKDKENEMEMNADINNISVIEEADDPVGDEANASFSDNSNNNSPNQMETNELLNNKETIENSEEEDENNNIINSGLDSTTSSLFDPDETLGFDEEIPINNEKLTNKVMKITNFMTPTKGRDSFSYTENYSNESINSSKKPTRLFNSSELSPINTLSYSSMKGSVVMIDEIPLSKRKRELLVDDIASTIFSPVRRSVRLNHSPVPVSPHLFDNSKIKYLPNPALDPLMDEYPPNKRQKLSLLTPHK